ncbi:cation efflux protein, CzcI family [Paucimonas lemoignei]|uniref:cation efflux protein, CzcI family n=1 Tax=Paucimonas lemoignei TaxID=29443 RepID=UPI00104ACC60|nr:cation efflux protein, CzcI family [Paucimonas lemoignei]
MKKLLMILLLTILPLQYSWAAAAVYCQHEQGHASHFGHHSHQHQGHSDQSEADGKSKVKQFHSDCEYCHFFGQSPFIAAAPTVAVTAPGHHPALLLQSFTSHIEDGPRRPDRSLVA